MLDNQNHSASLFDQLQAALRDNELDKAQAILAELDALLRRLSQQQIIEDQVYFTDLHERLLHAVANLTEQRAKAKKQLTQYKSNTNKLKAYSK
tara:strand:- start:11381 stop:11662 length:282 start_codon:yes stop_codon:yes gene_type:complete